MALSADDIRVACPLFQEERGGSTPTSALQLHIRETDVHTACSLNHLWHSRFPEIHWSNVVRNKRSVCFVAESANIFYASAIWSSPVAANRISGGDKCLELRRLAIAPDAPKNTASRMLGVMRRWIFKSFTEIERLISYQDCDVHLGTIYRASGWSIKSESEFKSWTTGDRARNAEQSKAKKIRWELARN